MLNLNDFLINKNFQDFVDSTVNSWPKVKKKILNENGLAGIPDISNREQGDQAERYIKDKLKSKYSSASVGITPGSKSPADIFSLRYVKNLDTPFYHLMLIQVKSSKKKETIYQLNENEIKVFERFSGFAFDSLLNYGLHDNIDDSNLIVSFGIAGVWASKAGSRLQTDKTSMYGYRYITDSHIGIEFANDIIIPAHSLR
jgi:hypothetical protein